MRAHLSAPTLLATALLATWRPTCAAQETDAVRAKDAEVRELRRRLEQAERELEQLRRDNERLRRAAETTPESPNRPAHESRPVRPLDELPPLAPDTVVDAEELVAHYAGDPVAAAARYAKQTFRVRGEVERFSTGLVARRFTVVLASADRLYRVECRFNYIDRYRTVFTTRNGRGLTARYESGRKVALLEAGQTVTIAGRCEGLTRDGAIEFSRCEIVR